MGDFEDLVWERSRYHYAKRMAAEFDRLVYGTQPQGETMSYVKDASDLGSPEGDLVARLEHATTYHKVTRQEVQDRMQTVRVMVKELGHGLLGILPRCGERDDVVEALVDLCQDAIGSLARYQDLIPEREGLTSSMQGNWDCGAESSPDPAPSPPQPDPIVGIDFEGVRVSVPASSLAALGEVIRTVR